MFDHIHEGWNVAELLITSAVTELSFAHHHRLDERARISNGTHSALANPQEWQGAEDRLEAHTLHRHLINAVLLFQAGMESMIGWCAENEPALSTLKEGKKGKTFGEKWELALGAVSAPTSRLVKYLDFYRDVRNPIIHCGKPADIKAIRSMTFCSTYLGIRDGWAVFEDLRRGLGIDGAINWEGFCGDFNLPASIEPMAYPEIGEAVRLLRSGYQRWIRTLNQ